MCSLLVCRGGVLGRGGVRRMDWRREVLVVI